MYTHASLCTPLLKKESFYSGCLELGNHPAEPSHVLGLQVCASTLDSIFLFNCLDIVVKCF